MCRPSMPNELNHKDNKKQKEWKNRHEILSINHEEDYEELETVRHDIFEDMREKNKTRVKKRKLNRANKMMIKVKQKIKHK